MTFNDTKEPKIPKGYNWKIEEHISQGEVDISAISLYVSPAQKKSYIKGTILREQLKEKKTLNANVLDYLFDNPHLIPEEWKGKEVFFWGTIYHDSDSNLYVRCLVWIGGHWRQRSGWLAYNFFSDYPSAVAESTLDSEYHSMSLDTLSLERAIGVCVMNGYKVTKEL